MKRRAIQVICLWAIILSASTLTYGVEFAGVTGTGADPYQIATAEQLISIGSDPNLLDKHFVLVNDIDLDPNLSPAYAFDQSVIGSTTSHFWGAFDGNGFRIRHLTIKAAADSTSKANSEWLGLFSRISEYGGEVRHVILEEVNISGSSQTDYIGALCGVNSGIVYRCFVSGTVSGNSAAGGMVGSNNTSGSIRQCVSTCTVSGVYAGGLTADNWGDIEECYASGVVSGTQCGGLTGRANNYWSWASHCYAACWIGSAGSKSGGLVGGVESGTIVDCYFLTYHDDGGPDNGFGTVLTKEQMKQVSSFVGWEFWGIGNNGFRVPWSMPEDGYPELAWLALRAIPSVRGLAIEDAYEALADAGVQTYDVVYDYDPAVEYGRAVMARPNPVVPAGRAADILVSLGPCDWSANSGTGEPNDPYLILSPGQLECLARQPQVWDKSFRLVTDMDMAWRIYKTPLIGTSEAFNGVFDGDGHIIRHLTFETGGPDGNWSDMLGLFGEIGPSGRITDLGVSDISIRGERYQWEMGGMLCAVNCGRVAQCYAVGVLEASGTLGGLAGRNKGVIENCYAQGTICDLMGREDPWRHDGGLVAENIGGTLRTCYAACAVQTRLGDGLVAYNEGGCVEQCLWDVEASGVQTSVGGTGVTTEELMSVLTVQENGWGGNPNWVIDDGKDYPRLTWEGTPGIPIPADE